MHRAHPIFVGKAFLEGPSDVPLTIGTFVAMSYESAPMLTCNGRLRSRSGGGFADDELVLQPHRAGMYLASKGKCH